MRYAYDLCAYEARLGMRQSLDAARMNLMRLNDANRGPAYREHGVPQPLLHQDLSLQTVPSIASSLSLHYITWQALSNLSGFSA